MQTNEINNLVINKLTKAQYDSIASPSSQELYFVIDDLGIAKEDIINALQLSTTTNAIAKYGDTHGTFVNSGVTIDSSNNINTNGSMNANHFLAEHVSGGQNEFRVTYGSTIDMSFMVGTANKNHGIYDHEADKWMIFADENGNVTVNGNAETATTAGYSTTAARAITAGYAVTAANATTASKLGTVNVGTEYKPIYLVNGVATANHAFVPETGGTFTGDVDFNGNVSLNNETTANSLAAGSLLVNGAANFVQSPTAPTPEDSSNDTTIATTEFVKRASANDSEGNAINTTYLKLSGGAMTGNIHRFYSAASTEPMITALSNNRDIFLWEVGHGTTATTTTTQNHYKLKYIGTNAAPNNHLQLIASTGTTDTVAVQITENGNITLNGSIQVAGSGGLTVTSLSASQAVVTDANKKLVSRDIRNNTAIGALGWTSASTDITLVTTNTIAYWNGAYKDTSSNLKYSINGEIMGLSTAQTVSGTKTFSAIQKFTNITDAEHSTDTAAAVSISGGVSVAKRVAAKEVKIDDGSTTKGVAMQYDSTLEVLNFVFA